MLYHSVNQTDVLLLKYEISHKMLQNILNLCMQRDVSNKIIFDLNLILGIRPLKNGIRFEIKKP